MFTVICFIRPFSPTHPSSASNRCHTQYCLGLASTIYCTHECSSTLSLSDYTVTDFDTNGYLLPFSSLLWHARRRPRPPHGENIQSGSHFPCIAYSESLVCWSSQCYKVKIQQSFSCHEETVLHILFYICQIMPFIFKACINQFFLWTCLHSCSLAFCPCTYMSAFVSDRVWMKTTFRACLQEDAWRKRATYQHTL